jgi:hypothetical protein
MRAGIGIVFWLRVNIQASAPCARVRPPLVRMSRKSSSLSKVGPKSVQPYRVKADIIFLKA